MSAGGQDSSECTDRFPIRPDRFGKFGHAGQCEADFTRGTRNRSFPLANRNVWPIVKYPGFAHFRTGDHAIVIGFRGLASRSLSDTELITYLDVDGNELYGVIYYPTEYVPSVRYPTIFLVYERFFDNRFNAGINHLTSRGYAVVQPSVQFEQGYPGEAWLKGVTAAANKVIDMGLADPDRLGVHGTSYGGYATNLLIAQTKRFKAAINISGKVNMVSFYTDSPRIGTRNIRAPERGQDRIGATLWEQPQKYIATSAIMDADRITTPLLLLTGDQDHNVPGRQAMEMFYALRRLGQTVEWVNYINGGHGTPTSEVGEVHDYYQRILGWYDKYLKGDDDEAVVLRPQNGNGRDG